MTDEEVQTIRRVRMRLNPKLLAAERSLQKHQAVIQRRRDRKQPVNEHAYPPGKSQVRLLILLGLTIPERWEWAAEMLQTAGFVSSGNPYQKDWRHVQYMGDGEFMEAAKISIFLEQMRQREGNQP